MRINIKLAALSLIICVVTAGCVSRDVEPLAGGFDEVIYTTCSLNGEPAAQRTSIQCRERGGRPQMIWPSLFGTKPLIKGDLILFVGDQGYRQPPGYSQGTRPRLFAAKADSLPLDLTDEVLWRWSKQSGEDFPRAVKESTILGPKEKDNGVEFCFASGPDVYLTWEQIADVIREVKANGVLRKDQMWGVLYLVKDFNL